MSLLDLAIAKALGGGSGGGGVSSWNDLTDKPFGEVELAPITWDGNTNGRDACTIVEMPVSLYKVDDRVFTADQFDGSTLFLSYGGSTMSQPIIKDLCFGNDSTIVVGEMMVMSSSMIGEVIISSPSGTTVTLQIPSAGTYFLDVSSNGVVITGVEFPSSIKQIDEKYIPDTIARVSDIGDIETALDNIIALQNNAIGGGA